MVYKVTRTDLPLGATIAEIAEAAEHVVPITLDTVNWAQPLETFLAAPGRNLYSENARAKTVLVSILARDKCSKVELNPDLELNAYTLTMMLIPLKKVALEQMEREYPVNTVGTWE